MLFGSGATAATRKAKRSRAHCNQKTPAHGRRGKRPSSYRAKYQPADSASSTLSASVKLASIDGLVVSSITIVGGWPTADECASCGMKFLKRDLVGVSHEALLVRLYFGICAAPQTHRIITAFFCEAGPAQKIAERNKKSRTAGPPVGRVFRKRVHQTTMGLS